MPRISNDTPLERGTFNTREAAHYIGIGERTFWDLIAPRGPIEPTRIGRRVLFLRGDLDRFLQTHALINSPSQAGVTHHHE